MLRAFENAEEFFKTINKRNGLCVCRMKNDNNVVMSPHIMLMMGEKAMDTLIDKKEWAKMFSDVEFIDGQPFGIETGV